MEEKACKVITTVCEFFGVSEDVVYEKHRYESNLFFKYLVTKLIYESVHPSAPNTAWSLDLGDHTTVLNRLRKHEVFYEVNVSYREAYKIILSSLGQITETREKTEKEKIEDLKRKLGSKESEIKKLKTLITEKDMKITRIEKELEAKKKLLK